MKIAYEFGGPIASAYPLDPDWNRENRLIWHLFGGDIEALRSGCPGPTVGTASKPAGFKRFAEQFFAQLEE